MVPNDTYVCKYCVTCNELLQSSELRMILRCNDMVYCCNDKLRTLPFIECSLPMCVRALTATRIRTYVSKGTYIRTYVRTCLCVRSHADTTVLHMQTCTQLLLQACTSCTCDASAGRVCASLSCVSYVKRTVHFEVVRMSECVRACVRACVRVCVRACVRA